MLLNEAYQDSLDGFRTNQLGERKREVPAQSLTLGNLVLLDFKNAPITSMLYTHNNSDVNSC